MKVLNTRKNELHLLFLFKYYLIIINYIVLNYTKESFLNSPQIYH